MAKIMSKNPFKHLWVDSPQPDDLLTQHATQFAEQRADPNVTKMFADVNHLLECSLAIFRGLYPSESPFFLWGEALWLPWLKDYWKEEGELMHPRPIEGEVAQILDALGFGEDGFAPADFPAHTYHAARLGPELRLKVQGLVVETLLAADTFVDLVIQNDLAKAVPWLAAAFKFHLEVVQHALPLAERSNIARTSAGARHAENRAMKAEVFTWLDANMPVFKTLDQAADAIAGKVAPIAWRTARSWVGEWKKLRAAGRE